MTEIILGVIIALTQIGGYYFYYLSVKNGVRPNITSWTIWTYGSLLNLISYISLTGDWVKDLLPMACSAACIALYIHILLRGKIEKLTAADMTIIGIDIIATALWLITDSALVGNLALQVSTIVSFIPIIREVYDEDENETPLPWLIWSVAYGLDVLLVAARWEKWGDVVYPATCFVLHFLMWFLVTEHFKAIKTKRSLQKINLSIGTNYEVEEHLYVDNSKIAGNGIFTSKPIKKGEVAFRMKGPLMYFAPKTKEEALMFPNIVGIAKNIYIDPVAPYVYLNHRCEPNMGVSEDAVTYIALRDIAANEELTFDYSTSEYTPWEMPCACGAEKCRKLICSIDKLPPEYYSNYFPHVAPYFEKIYWQKYIKDHP